VISRRLDDFFRDDGGGGEGEDEIPVVVVVVHRYGRLQFWTLDSPHRLGTTGLVTLAADLLRHYQPQPLHTTVGHSSRNANANFGTSDSHF
jgi:hypothetical protein